METDREVGFIKVMDLARRCGDRENALDGDLVEAGSLTSDLLSTLPC